MLKLRELLRDVRSAAALEFAFVAQILLALLLGVFEIANAALVYEQLQNAAHTMPASASNLAVSGTGATVLSYSQIQLVESEIWAEVPELRTGFEDGTKSITMSSVAFIQTYPQTPTVAVSGTAPSQFCNPTVPATGGAPTHTCQYTPTVVWSVAYAGGNSGRSFNTGVVRSCTGVASASNQQNATVVYANPGTPTTYSYKVLPGGLNNASPPSGTVSPKWSASDLTSLPTFAVANPDPNVAAPSPVLVVDIHLRYKPIFGLFIPAPGIDFYATGFWPVRSVQSATINPTSGLTTAQNLSQQFTTIVDDASDASAGTLAGAPGGTYCINNSPYLNPGATSTTGTS